MKNGGKSRTGLAARVRRYLRGFEHLKNFRCPEVAQALGLKRAKRVREVFHDMLRRGEILKISKGNYVYQKRYEIKNWQQEVRPRIYRAMHAQRIFSAREIIIFSDAAKATGRKRIKILIETGDLVPAGRQKAPRGNMERLYRLRNVDRFFLEYIHTERERP